MCFVDMKKAFDKVPRRVIDRDMKKKGFIRSSDGTSTKNRNGELKILKVFLVSESENFNQISDSGNDSLEFVCLQLKLQSKNIGT